MWSLRVRVEDVGFISSGVRSYGSGFSSSECRVIGFRAEDLRFKV